MFELLDAWRQVLAVSEWTGLSLGALAALAAAAYLGWQDAFVRKVVIAGAYSVVLAYACLTYGAATMHRDDVAEAADKARKAELAAKKHDADIEMVIRGEYAKEIAALQRPGGDNKLEVETHDRAMLRRLAAGPSCQLGTDALRLRVRPAGAK